MNLFDIIILAIVISSCLMGLYKGLIRLSIGLISFCLSLGASYLLFPLVEDVVSQHVQNAVVVNIISGVVAYLISMIFFAFLSSQVTTMASSISGGLLDRILGFALGLLRGLLICIGIFGIIAIFVSDAYVESATAKDVADKIDRDKYPGWLTSAVTFDIIENSAKIFGKLIPDEMLKSIDLPKPSKQLPKIPSEVINNATNAATEHVIEHLMHKQDAKNNEAGAVDNIPKNSEEIDTLDSQLEEILGQ